MSTAQTQWAKAMVPSGLPVTVVSETVTRLSVHRLESRDRALSLELTLNIVRSLVFVPLGSSCQEG